MAALRVEHEVDETELDIEDGLQNTEADSNWMKFRRKTWMTKS